jgi:hypothetical protein
LHHVVAGIIALLSVNLAVVQPSYADPQSAPGIGFAYGTKENSFIMYECNQSGANLDCQFTQSSIRRKLSSQDAKSKLIEARAQFPAAKKELLENDGRFCKEVQLTKSVLSGKTNLNSIPDKMREGISKLGLREKQDLSLTMNAIDKFCSNPTEENYLAFVRLGLEHDQRTCSVIVNPYKQSFAQIQGTNNWVVIQQEGPTGPCGIVNISRFESETSSKINFWNYFAKKVVTNKSGDVLQGLMKCTDLDEAEYEYNWKSRQIYMGCDYITLGGF